MSAVSGVGFGGVPIRLDTSGKKATVLMVFSPVCHFCEQNWHNWTSLIGQNGDRNIAFVVADITETATEEFVAKKHAEKATILHQVAPQDMLALDLNVTPQTIVIGADSKVKRVWTGELSPHNMDELQKLLL